MDNSQKQTHRVAIFGQGYTGIPYAETIINHTNYDVIAVDPQTASIKLPETLVGSERYEIFESMPAVPAHIYVVCVPTWAPDDGGVNIVVEVLREIARHIAAYGLDNHNEPYVLIDSTVAVSGTDTVFDATLACLSHICNLVVTPEIIDPGRDIDPAGLPRIVAAYDMCKQGDAVNIVRSLGWGNVVDASQYGGLWDDVVAAKIWQNTQRYFNIVAANAFAHALQHQSANLDAVFKLAAMKPYGYADYRPGLGIGGACIPHDPFLWPPETPWSDLLRRVSRIQDKQSYEIVRTAHVMNECLFGRKTLSVYGYGGYKPGITDGDDPSDEIIALFERRGYTTMHNPSEPQGVCLIAGFVPVPHGGDVIITPDTSVMAYNNFAEQYQHCRSCGVWVSTDSRNPMSMCEECP